MSADAFTLRRLEKFIENFRAREGQLPTLNDLDRAGFDSGAVKAALKEERIEEFYVTLTTGSVVKGYKLKD